MRSIIDLSRWRGDLSRWRGAGRARPGRSVRGRDNRGSLRGYRPAGAVFNVFAAALALLVAGGPAAADEVRVLVLGDSLTAGYGLQPGDAFPARLEAALRARGHAVTVLNAGVSGDTTAGGLARLGWALADRPDAAIVQLGANDALRGLDPAAAEANLDRILARLRGEGIPVLLAGMLAPPNLGREYGDAFNAIYARLADKHGAILYPFFLDGVAAEPALNQADGIHPNRAGVARIVAGILPYAERLVAAARPRARAGP